MTLNDVLNRCRAAIVGTTQPSPASQPSATPRPLPKVPTVQELLALKREQATSKAAAQPAPRVRAAAPQHEHEQAQGLKAGPRRLYELLSQVGRKVASLRGYSATVSQVVIHQSQELLAAALGVHRVTIWRWTQELQEAGLLDARAHKGTTQHQGAAVTRNDGTVYAVSLKSGHRARLRFDDLKHKYRDLDADRRQDRTAHKALQQSDTLKQVERELLILQWAVTPGNIDLTPVQLVDCCAVLDVVYALPTLTECDPQRRGETMRQMGAALAARFNDRASVGFWVKTIQDAYRDSMEGRAGLQGLAAQLTRLQADVMEWGALRNPAALFAARSKTA